MQPQKVKFKSVQINMKQVSYNDLRQKQRTPAMSQKLVFRWQKQFQDGFTNFEDGSLPGQPRIVVTNAYIAAVADLIKRDARHTVKTLRIVLAHYWGQLNRF